MKNLLLLIVCGMVLLTSCSQETEAVDFTGNWAGETVCDNDNELVVFEITSTDKEGVLNILFTDDDETFDDSFTIQATVSEDQLTITNQMVNEGGEFDVLQFDGSGTILENGDLLITMTVDVDGETQMCTVQLTKR